MVDPDGQDSFDAVVLQRQTEFVGVVLRDRGERPACYRTELGVDLRTPSVYPRQPLIEARQQWRESLASQPSRLKASQ